VLLEFKCSTASSNLYAWGAGGSVNSINGLYLTSDRLHHWWWSNDLRWYFSSSGMTIANICDGTWHTTGTQFDGTTRRIFFDGATVASDTPTGSHANINTNFCLGAEAAGNTRAFTGSIRRFEVFASGSVAATTYPPIEYHQLCMATTAGGGEAGLVVNPNECGDRDYS
jgi:hypothetical protein